MAPRRQISLRSFALLFTGTAITIGLVRAILLPPSAGWDGQILAPVIGAWCGLFYGSFLGMPLRCTLLGGAAGLAYVLFAPPQHR